jgi:Spy/CpxP family protein refolding chaperone
MTVNIKSKIVTVAVLGSLMLTGASAFAGPGKEGKELKQERAGAGGAGGAGAHLLKDRIERAGELAKELNLTAEQKKQMKEAAGPFRETMRAQMKTVVEKRQALRQAVIADNANETSIRAAATDLGKAAGDAAVTGSKVYAAIKPILTADQLKKLEAFRKENKDAMDKFLEGAGND